MIDSGFLLKFFKFCVVGCSGFVIDFGSTWFCKEKLKLNKYVANTVGFVLAASNNYLWNRLWTFQSSNNQIAIEYGKFFLVSLIGLGINNLIVYLLHGKFKCNFYISKIIATFVVTIWNFAMNYLFTF